MIIQKLVDEEEVVDVNTKMQDDIPIEYYYIPQRIQGITPVILEIIW